MDFKKVMENRAKYNAGNDKGSLKEAKLLAAKKRKDSMEKVAKAAQERVQEASEARMKREAEDKAYRDAAHQEVIRKKEQEHEEQVKAAQAKAEMAAIKAEEDRKESKLKADAKSTFMMWVMKTKYAHQKWKNDRPNENPHSPEHKDWKRNEPIASTLWWDEQGGKVKDEFKHLAYLSSPYFLDQGFEDSFNYLLEQQNHCANIHV